MEEFFLKGREGDDDQELLVIQDEEEDEDGGSVSNYTLKLSPTTIAIKSEIFCLAFSGDGRFLLACCGDGIARVLNPHTGVVMSVLVSERRTNGRTYGKVEAGGGGGGKTSTGKKSVSSILDDVALPCTCAAFRPHNKRGERTNGVAVLGFSHGEIQLWHVPSAKILHRQAVPPLEANARPQSPDRDGEEKDEGGRAREARGSLLQRKQPTSDENKEEDLVKLGIGVEVLCCSFSADGEFFAVGASDGVVRVYSDSSRELLAELKPGMAQGSGHSSRVFSVKFHPDDSNLIISGGWGNCVHVWDIEKATVVRTFFGPHICGDAVCCDGRTIVTGSWRDEAQLEAWDMNSGKASGPPFWCGHGKGALLQQSWGRRCRLYAAAFGGPEESPAKFLAAGGGEGANEVKVFDFPDDKRLIGSLLGLSAGAISLAFEPRGKQLAVGLANGQVRLVDIEATAAGRDQQASGGKTIMVF